MPHFDPWGVFHPCCWCIHYGGVDSNGRHGLCDRPRACRVTALPERAARSTSASQGPTTNPDWSSAGSQRSFVRARTPPGRHARFGGHHSGGRSLQRSRQQLGGRPEIAACAGRGPNTGTTSSLPACGARIHWECATKYPDPATTSSACGREMPASVARLSQQPPRIRVRSSQLDKRAAQFSGRRLGFVRSGAAKYEH